MEILSIRLFFSFIISFLLTLYLVPIFCAIARRLCFVDVPDGKIKKHKNPTPYLGGLAVYCGFIGSLAFVLPFENQIGLLLVGMTLLLFVGLIDDFITLKPYQKFFGQVIAAFCFMKSGFYLKAHFFSNLWSFPISLIWILSIINAFNLVDVMDGLATVLAISATLSFLVFALYLQHQIIAIVLTVFLGALCAFFLFNKPTARIYLGDAGSLCIGGFLATVPFLINWGTYSWFGYLAPIIILALPLLEVTTLIAVRTYKKIPFYQGSLDHFSIYLQQNGWNKCAILKYVAVISLLLFLTAFVLVINYISLCKTIIIMLLFFSVWIRILFWKHK